MAIDLNDLATAISQLVLRFRLRRRTAADWTATNEVLYGSEMGHESDTNKVKIGDGTTAWNSLKYFVGVTLVAGSGVSINNADPTAPVISASGGSGGGSSNMTPDTHPGTPTSFDDEFEYGTSIDVTGGRASGATAWTVLATSGYPAPGVKSGMIHSDLTALSTASIMMSQPFPATGDCTFVMKAKRTPKNTNNTGWRIHVLNSANGNCFSVQTTNTYATLTETDTYNMTTGVRTGVSNPYLDNTNFPYPAGVSPWMWFRLRISGTNIYPGWSDTGHPDDYVEGSVMAFSTFLGARPTHVGINMPGAMNGVCDYFRRVA